MRRGLKKQLDHVCGFKDIEFIIPHVFLPPRFVKVSKNRNMVLTIDMDMVPHVYWEGALQDAYHPLTPGAVRKLLRECVRNMKKYRQDLDVFARFVDGEAEMPFWDPRVDSLAPKRDPKDAEEDPFFTEVVAVVEGGRLKEGNASDFLDQGGENPMPKEMFDW